MIANHPETLTNHLDASQNAEANAALLGLNHEHVWHSLAAEPYQPKTQANQAGSESKEATRIHDGLTQLHNWTGRSNHNTEKDLRDTLATMNSTQIAAVDKQYQSQFHTSLKDALNNDRTLSTASKQALTIYAKGADNRSQGDTIRLAGIATTAGNLDMFEEAFRDAAPGARAQYLASGGEARVKTAFTGTFSNADVRHAMDYLQDGKLSVATQVRDNTGVFSSNRDAIELAIAKLTPAQREQYQQGGMNDLHLAIQKAGNSKDILKWNGEISAKPVAGASGKNSDSAGQAHPSAAEARDAFDNARDKEYAANDGMGRSLIHNFWDGTSDMSSDAVNQYAAEMSKNAAAGTVISADAQAAHTKEVGQSLESLKSAKNAAGNAVADGALIVAGVGGAAFTGGASLALISGVTAGGAALKIGTKAAISGSDYDYSAGQILADGASGAVTAATMFVGPAQIGKLAGLAATGSEKVALKLGTTVALNSAAGAASGIATGTVEGMTNWDSKKSFGANIGQIGESAALRGVTGAVLAGAMSGAIGLGARYNFARAAESQPVANIVEKAPSVPPTHNEIIESKFAPMPKADRPALRAQVAEEMKDVAAIKADGTAGNAYDSLVQEPNLSIRQKENILNNMGLVREHLASYRLGDRMHPDPEVNWIHTQGEIAKVLEVSRAGKLKPEELEDALLASMYSDSVKFSHPAPEGTVPNFHTHHLDGATAAEHSLKLQGFPQERIDGIVDAILAHQVSPPKFMGQLYYMKISGSLEAMIKDGSIGAAEGNQMRETLTAMTTVGPDGVKRISKLAEVQDAAVSTSASGRQQVIFTPEEQKVFALSGTDTWTVPYKSSLDPEFKTLSRAQQELRVSRGRVAEKMSEADGVDNYATRSGASKIVAIRGPKTFFQDKTVWDSIGSIDASYKDSYTLMSREGRALADTNRGELNQVTNRDGGELKAHLDGWLKATKNLDAAKDSIPFYNAPLTYAKPGEVPTAAEASAMQLAEEIRTETVNYLRSSARTSHDLPGNFVPVRK